MKKKIFAIMCAFNLITTLPIFGMNNNINQENNHYLCDLCNIPALRIIRNHSCNVECYHLVCRICSHILDRFSTNPIRISWWGCDYCSYYIHNEINIRLHITNWGTYGETTSGGISLVDKNVDNPNQYIKYYMEGSRVPNPTNQMPRNIQAEEFEVLLPENRDNPNNPDNPPIQDATFIIDNKIKWFGITCIAGVACYCAYKAYNWWKDEDTHDENADDEQKTLKNEEQITA